MRWDQDHDGAQPDLFAPRPDGWYEVGFGSARVLVVADGTGDAMAKAEAELRGIGYLPGGPPEMHESWLRICESGRRVSAVTGAR